MNESSAGLRDYSADSRLLYVSALATALGALCAVAAWLLLELVLLSNNLFYFHHWSFANRDPWLAGKHWWTFAAPILGGLIVGVIARYFSPKVRGHGMPEAIETIVFGGGKVQPRVAVLKPLATAVSIGSGAPFGAEGPVIITGGAIGSLIAQMLPMTDSERTVLMVAGASAGMAATFNCPLAAILLAVEILLFEWKPRSLVPVAIASVTAGAVRRLLLGPGPLLQMPNTGEPINHSSMLGALVVGVATALLAVGLARSIHAIEHAFSKTGLHWMWWPAIGGIGIALGGLAFPQALGVGYSVIQRMLSDDGSWHLLIGILLVKSFVWVFALGSETAGGILAPILMIGGALGAALGHLMPVMTTGAWVLVGMTSVLSAAIGCPLTSAILAIELTHNGSLTLPVLLSCVTAYAVSVLVQPRSMLTESLSRRGLHLTRELGVDPLETILVNQAMHTSVFVLPETATRRAAADWLRSMQQRGARAWSHWQRVFPLLDSQGRLTGMLTRAQMIEAAADSPEPLINFGTRTPLTASPTQTLRACASLMAESQLTCFPVVDARQQFEGVITINDLLLGRQQQAQRESTRERVLRLRWPFGADAREKAEEDLETAAEALEQGVTPPIVQESLESMPEFQPREEHDPAVHD